MSDRQQHLSVDELVDLANGLMDQAAADSALDHVRNCTLCEEGLQEVSAARERAQAAGPPAKRSRARILLPVGLLAAAGLALFFWMGTPQQTEPYWLPVPERTTTLRSAGEASPPEYERALEAYGRRDAELALRELESAEVPDNLEPERLLYLASARQITGDCEGCLRTLDLIGIESIPQPDRDRARWIQYRCLAGAGRDAEAESVLVDLSRSYGELADRAREELERLNDRRP